MPPKKKKTEPERHAINTVQVVMIAVGNTHTRIGWYGENNIIVCCKSFKTTDLAKSPRKIANYIQSLKQAPALPLHLILGGVVPKTCDKIEAFFKKDQTYKVWRFRKNLPCPLKIVPRPAKNVGDDRLLAALGALDSDKPRPWVVVDAGTAVTVNAVRPAKGKYVGVFEGGLIFPGEALSLRALHEGTAKLPLLEPYADIEWYREHARVPAIGRSTKEAIAAGVRRAQVAAVLASIEAQLDELGPRARVCLTGGGGDTFWWTVRKKFSRRKSDMGELVTLGLLCALMRHKPKLFDEFKKGAR